MLELVQEQYRSIYYLLFKILTKNFIIELVKNNTNLYIICFLKYKESILMVKLVQEQYKFMYCSNVIS